MAEGLKLVLGADIKDAQAALRKVVADAKVAGKEVEKSFGNARLPLGDIKGYTASIQNLKQNLAGVTFAPLRQGIQGAGEAATSSLPKIGGLLSSLGRGGLVAAVSLAVGALISLVKSFFDSADASEKSEAALKSYQGQIDRVKGSVKGLAEELNFLNQLAAINARVFKIPDVTKLRGESFAQRENTVRLEGERDKLKAIGKQITDDQELNAEDREKALANNAKAIEDINQAILESERKQRLIYRTIAEQKVDDAEDLLKKEQDIRDKSLADFERFVSQTISKAKELSSFLEKRGIVDIGAGFEIDPRKSKLENFEAAKKFITKAVNSDFPFIEIKPQVRVNLKDFSAGASFVNFSKEVISVSDQLQKRVDQLTKNNPILLQAAINRKEGEELFKQETENAERLASTVNGLLTPAFDGLFDAIKSGENPLKAFFEGLGQAVLQLIQKLIQAAITAAILSAILPGGGGGFASLFGKFLGLAGGGLVSGPTLAAVGEGSGTSLSNPEVVAPLDQLKAMLGDIGTGGSQVVVLRTQISGNNLALVQARTSRRNKRLGATG